MTKRQFERLVSTAKEAKNFLETSIEIGTIQGKWYPYDWYGVYGYLKLSRQYVQSAINQIDTELANPKCIER